MNPIYAAVTALTVVMNAGATIADVVKADFVVKTSAEVGVARSYLPLLAALKGAGAAGLLLALLGVPAIGTAAAAGLVVFFAGALAFHIRARVFYNIAFPGFFLAAAGASLALSILER